MTRNLKVRGLAIALLTIIATATPAQAENAEFTAAAYPATLSSSQIGALTALKVGNGVRSVHCETATLSATITGSTNEITATPTYAGCTATGVPRTTVTTNGCTYTLRSTSTPSGATASASLELVCPAGKKMEVHIYETIGDHEKGASLCTYDISPIGKPYSGTITLQNKEVETVKENFEAQVNLKEIPTVSTVGIALLCGGAAGATVNSTLIGNVTFTGTKSGSAVPVMVGSVPKFTASEYPASLSGGQSVQHAFAMGLKEVECTEAKFPGSLTSASTTVTITPEYGACRTEFNLPTTVTMNGCSYTLHTLLGTTIDCPAGKKIEVHIYETEKKHLAGESLCTIKTSAQGPREKVSYENGGSGSSEDVLIKFSLTGISYEVEGPKLQCGTSGSNGEYTGSTTEIAKNGGGEQIGWMIG